MAAIAEYFRLALTNLTHRRTRAYLTMVGIFIGIAAVVSLIALGQGLREGVAAQFAGFGADKIMISAKSVGFGPPGTGAVSNITTRDLRVVEGVRGVDSATGRLIRQARLEYRDESRFGFLATIPEDAEGRRIVMSAINAEAEHGRFVEPGEAGKITVGNSFSERDGMFERPVQVGDRLLLNDESYEVVGIVEKTGTPFIGESIFINEGDARELLDIDENYDAIIAQVNNPDDVPAVAEAITRALRNFRDVDEETEDFSVQTTEQFLEALDTILVIVQVVLVGIAAISLLVGGIGIMNTMYTSVIERTKEIGVMKAIGATNGDVLAIFLIESGLLGLVGGAIGIAIGMGLAKLVELAALAAFESGVITASFSWQLIGGALAFSFIIGSLSGLWPALRAARLRPVDALRYE